MDLKELRYSIYFDYVKDIRRYCYDIEDFFKTKLAFGYVEAVPPVPDEMEPLLERLVVSKRTNKTKDIVFKLSQLSFSISFLYKDNLEESKDKELDELKELANQIKKFIKEKIVNFKINYETIGMAEEKIEQNANNIETLAVEPHQDEVTSRVSTEKDNKYFFIDQRSALKVFNAPSIAPTKPVFTKNSQEFFLGWQVSSYKEISNRLEYNQSKDEKELELNFDEVKELLC